MNTTQQIITARMVEEIKAPLTSSYRLTNLPHEMPQRGILRLAGCNKIILGRWYKVVEAIITLSSHHHM